MSHTLHKCYTMLACLGLLLVANVSNIWAQQSIQVNGVVLTSDSLSTVPYATVMIKHKEVGTFANERGIFTLIVKPGDTLVFTGLGYRMAESTVPLHYEDKYMNVVQLMTQDTFYLPEMIIIARPDPFEFDYAFRHWEIPVDQIELARRQVSKEATQVMLAVLPRDGRENVNNYMRMQGEDYHLKNSNSYIRQQKLGDIISWVEFIEAWKRGDFRKKRQR